MTRGSQWLPRAKPAELPTHLLSMPTLRNYQLYTQSGALAAMLSGNGVSVPTDSSGTHHDPDDIRAVDESHGSNIDTRPNQRS